jgi:RHS repeat-associated protein
LGLVILLAEHDEPSLAAKKKRRHVALEKATSTPKNRVWDFFGSAHGRTCSEPDLSWENATGSVQFSYETASGRGYYYTRDHLGSVRELCSSTGAIVSRMAYDPYGRTTTVSGTILPTKQYAGYYQHQTSGLYLTLYRAYDANTGRWLSRDPIGELGGINLYGYGADDPEYWVDPYGLAPGTLIGPGLATPEEVEAALAALGISGPPGWLIAAIIAEGGGAAGLTAYDIYLLEQWHEADQQAQAAKAMADAMDAKAQGARHESGQRNEMNRMAQEAAQRNGTTECEELAKMMAAQKALGRYCDSATVAKIKRAQKAAGCRPTAAGR